jgi:hypothetical protein
MPDDIDGPRSYHFVHQGHRVALRGGDTVRLRPRPEGVAQWVWMAHVIDTDALFFLAGRPDDDVAVIESRVREWIDAGMPGPRLE